MARSSRLPRGGWRLPLAAGILLGASAALSGCEPDRTPDLHGAWQATLLVEDGDTVEVRLDDVGLYFKPDGSYVYTSTLDYEEAGTYRLDGEYLYRTPRGSDPEGTLPVAIAKLEEDALHLNMVDAGRQRRLEFERAILEDDDHQHHDHDHDSHFLEDGELDADAEGTDG